MGFKNTITLYILIFTNALCLGQSRAKNTGYTKKIKIQSVSLQEEREIEIYLPPSYETIENKEYPVMYILDGQEYFLHPIAYQRQVHFKDKSPEFIVVGINSDRRKRRKLYYQDSRKFIEFLENELIPLIDKDFRTFKEKERIFFGWEMAGGLGLEIFARNKNLFSAFLLSSATHFTEQRLMNVDSVCKHKKLNKSFLYFTRASEEDYAESDLSKLNSIFQSNTSGNISWKYDTIAGEDHYTTPLKTVANGLNHYFWDYNTLRFMSLKEFDEFGDLDGIKSYYRHRANRYRVSPEIHRTTRHFLLLHAMTEDNFERFETYAHEFSDYLHNLRSDLWVIRFAGYLAENNQESQALSIYQTGLNKFPESARLNHDFGSYYQKKGNRQKATFYYKKAVEIAEKNNDVNLEEYKRDLNGSQP